MNQIPIIDGIPIVPAPEDYDGDGITGGIESPSSQGPVIPQDTSDLKEGLDILLPNVGDEKIIMVGNHEPLEEPVLFVVKTLVSLKAMPKEVLRMIWDKAAYSIARGRGGRNDVVRSYVGQADRDMMTNSQKTYNFASSNK